MNSPSQKPVWDRGEPIDPQMLAFTIGDDPILDRRLVESEIVGSMAHVRGLERSGLIQEVERDTLLETLHALLEEYRAGEWTVEPTEEDVHSAVEHRVTERLGDLGAKLHTGRSRNEEIALDISLWLRTARESVSKLTSELLAAIDEKIASHGDIGIPGYTHLRRAMPSTLADWLGAYRRAFELNLAELEASSLRGSRCPLGTGAGYGVPLKLDREYVAGYLGFEAPETPVTFVQHARGRLELAYLTALESLALDLGKFAADVWLMTTEEFSFATLPVELTTGSSLMPHKRNPDLVELMRAHARGVISDRAALLDVVRDLPSGYHRDFQLVKPPLFRAHDRIANMIPMASALMKGIEFDRSALDNAMQDDSLQATRRALEAAASGKPFRQAYVEESRSESART